MRPCDFDYWLHVADRYCRSRYGMPVFELVCEDLLMACCDLGETPHEAVESFAQRRPVARVN